MSRRFYRRDGRRASRKRVELSKQAYADAKRAGRMGLLTCSVQPDVAERVEAMSLEEYCRWSGHFTYRG